MQSALASALTAWVAAGRGVWDRDQMQTGAEWLARAACGDTFSRYHAEAGIAAEHCFAPSPLHTMNRAVAVAEWQGADAALALLADLVPPTWLEASYLWDAVLADLHRRAGHAALSGHHRDRALAAAPTDAVRELLRRRLYT